MNEENHALQQAAAQMNAIAEMVATLAVDYEDAERRIQEDPLSVQVRSGWYTPGDAYSPEEFEILLCTGGPAVRIIGDLDEYMQPARPRLQYQDWGTPWTEYFGANLDREALLAYCQRFWFGE